MSVKHVTIVESQFIESDRSSHQNRSRVRGYAAADGDERWFCTVVVNIVFRAAEPNNNTFAELCGYA